MGNGLNTKNSKVVILGLDNCGKSTLYNRIKLNKLILTKPTDGCICETFKVKLKETKINNTNLQLLDVNGRQNNRTMWVTYLHGSDAVIFVIDVSDKARFDEAKYELQALVLSSQSKDIPFLILFNKMDRPNCRNPEVLAKELDFLSMDSRRWWLVKCVCLITGEGLFEALDSLFELIESIKLQGKNPPYQNDDYILKSLNKLDYLCLE